MSRLAATLLIAATLLTAAACSRALPPATDFQPPHSEISWWTTPDPTGTAFYKGLGPAGGSGVEHRW